MDSTDLVLRRPRPTSGPRAAADHPAGEIRLRSGGGLGRRSRLLREPTMFRSTLEQWTTISQPVTDDPH
ncbi:hypothetical protein ACIRD3_10590 [Kitasatospora sp. NPDC093550]|uniref:hypothetical protein n=1 Tax=Kitasatospora sp. NPDC093550 TaxID=3364089 RepID=UPI003823491B